MLKNITDLNKYKDRKEYDTFMCFTTKNRQHEEYQYLNLLQDILDNGHYENGRNGITKCVFGSAMHFSLENGKIPILTTKKTAWKTCLKELLWFIKGETDNKILNNQKVHIWDANSTKEFMKSRDLEHYKEGDLGPIYGYQWRHFNATYNSCDADYTNNGIDQLQEVIKCLKDPVKRTSRRMIVSAWNPCQLDEMALPPCHILFQFNVVDDDKLSCSMYQRSVDCPLGSPFNIASYSFLTHLIAKHCDLKPYEFVYYLGNAHIYKDHLENMKEQIDREPYEFPIVNIKNKRDDINDYIVDDFEILDYKSHDAIKMKMVA